MNKNQLWYRGRPWLGFLAIGVLAFGFHSQLATAEEAGRTTTAIASTPEPEELTPQGSAPNSWLSADVAAGFVRPSPQERPVSQMTNMGEERTPIFRGHNLTPPGARVGPAILYAPSEGDSPPFRAQVSTACGGATVDYFDARTGTPTVSQLSAYSCVFTWANYPYFDSTLFGDNLAAYVDGGGTVILGQWTYPSDQGNFLGGTIMTSAYCPVTTTTSFSAGAYNGDGIDCVHTGVVAYDTAFLDVAILGAGNMSDGTFNNGANSLAVAWRPDRRVYYSPGNTGELVGTGEWDELLCNMCTCAGGPPPDCGDGVCGDGEDCCNCRDDCGDCECGDGVCDEPCENEETCPEDCAEVQQPTCDDIRRFVADCDHPSAPGMVRGMVIFTSNIFDGKTAVIVIDGVPFTRLINNGRARATVPGAPGSSHTVAFAEPDCCLQKRVFFTVSCP